MITIEICRQKPTKVKPLSKCEFWARIMKNGKEIWRTSETYKRRAGVDKAVEIIGEDMNCNIADLTNPIGFVLASKTQKKK